eukprot:TRINITY_DN7416_c0_g1_i1.p1 TRINITY_DN7416_c0_g1~~TRINITY_DN7416_c0_g1_i1.p1  ORF type:complete len:662 (+),score=184.03 TRINITY_DN7416_c0_g1_i1:141-1988(+)
MDATDKVLLLSLKSVGCEFDPSVGSVADFSPELIVEATARCLNVINPNANASTTLPSQMSSRFRVCTDLATAVTDLGYNQELGYHQFLYPNEKDTRNMLLFLVERLPKGEGDGEGQVGAESLSASALMFKNMLDSLKTWSPMWVPREYSKPSIRTRRALVTCSLATPDSLHSGNKATADAEAAYARTHLPLSSRQPETRPGVVPSILAHNHDGFVAAQEREALWAAAELETGQSRAELRRQRQAQISSMVSAALRAGAPAPGDASGGSLTLDQLLSSYEGDGSHNRGGIFSHQADFGQETDDSGLVDSEKDQAELAKERQAELDALQEEIAGITDEIQTKARESEGMVAKTRQSEQQRTELLEKRAVLEEEYKTKKRTFDLLDDLENNLVELRKLSQATAQRLMELGGEWEARRGPLVEQYRQKKDELAQRKQECQNKLERIKTMRKEMKDMVNSVRAKDGLHKQLVQEYERMPKDVDRALYTHRIMDIVKNVKKQNDEINKILVDSRNVRKEINQATEALARSHAATEELVFKDANKDPAAKQAYKSLAELHDKFGQLVDHVAETGNLTNEARDLEIKRDLLLSRNTGINMERIQADLKQIKGENAQLIAKLKG